jgi:hypothetical protein
MARLLQETEAGRSLRYDGGLRAVTVPGVSQLEIARPGGPHTADDTPAF